MENFITWLLWLGVALALIFGLVVLFVAAAVAEVSDLLQDEEDNIWIG